MLVLTRKKGEKIIIDDNIELTVVEIEGNKVKLGIDAPKSIEIHREEVYRRIEEENKEAASSKDLSRLGNLVIKKEEKDSK
ncbi:carbon storage regulator CsrA [Halanaerobiaceae bacterium Z-7014]|uniref:Translational regulator CsrA n=1 Tax=Halonatronomonas betaini TaxID=2778430 RepID=A0A931ARX6_9FIRM|nr:carbon storage regulator CsrA [Halonatronomonas betaini]MBF8437857.1 carbon storage regulator CsrA [Halonatronomonas betaini]